MYLDTQSYQHTATPPKTTPPIVLLSGSLKQDTHIYICFAIANLTELEQPTFENSVQLVNPITKSAQ